METTNYQKQADDFLQETKTEFKAEFFANMPYFVDDKEKRDVYLITLKRNGKEYTFKFGQSIVNSQGNPKEVKAYKGTKQYNRYLQNGYKPSKVMADFLIKKSIAPTAYDVLACIQKYDIGSFQDFCSEFGYDTDSKKAEKTYFAVQEEYQNINRLFSDVMDKLADIN